MTVREMGVPCQSLFELESCEISWSKINGTYPVVWYHFVKDQSAILSTRAFMITLSMIINAKSYMYINIIDMIYSDILHVDFFK